MPTIYADTHVHLYAEYDLGAWLETARDRQRQLGAPLLLLLADREGQRAFPALRDAGGRLDLHPTCEPGSLAFRHSPDGPFLIAGRQLVSREGIEVLTLCVDPAVPDRFASDGSRTALELVRAGLDAGALVALPWGAGKWIGRRGRIVRALAREPELLEHPRFFLSDSAQRPAGWPTPAQFQSGPRVLAGTDPLPLRGCEHGVARYGSALDGALDPERPAGSLLAALQRGGPLRTFGRRLSLLSALRLQLRYRLEARHPASGSPQ
jgi:hypothetical protein